MKILLLFSGTIIVPMMITGLAHAQTGSSSDFGCAEDSHPEIVNGETKCVENVASAETNIDENIFIWIGIGLVGVVLILLISKIKMSAVNK